MKAALLGSILLIAIGTVPSELSPAWKNWRFSSSVAAGDVETSRMIGVVVLEFVSAHSQRRWSDLRVIDEKDGEVPYVLYARIGAQKIEGRAGRLLEPSFLPGQYTQVVLDLSGDARVHNALRLEIEGHDDLLTWVELAVSEDAREWRLLRERAPIYRLFNARMGSRTDVSYPESHSRYLRIRILESSRQIHLVSADVVYELVTTAEIVPLQLTLSPAEVGQQQSAWVSTPDAAVVPVSEVRFQTAQGSFYRPVRVEISGDAEQWNNIASGEILRMVEGGKPFHQLAVRFPETWASHWRVTVYNHGDPPIADLHPKMYGTPRHVVFRQERGRKYRLIYGNSRATAPQYDMARLTDEKTLELALPCALGAEEINDAYADPAPWTERHPQVLWLALGVAVVVLGFLSLRSLRSDRSGSRSS